MSYGTRATSANAGLTHPFPVTYSILSTSALLAEILPRYDLGSQVRCLFLAHGVNDSYLVQTPNEKYILRAYQAGWRTLSDVLYEIEVLRQLEKAGVQVSVPVAQLDGASVCTLQAPEGIRYVVLFTYAPGAPLDRHDASDNYYHGGAVATLHNAADHVVSTHVRAPLDLSYLIDRSLQIIEPLQTCSADDWRALLEISERLRAQVQRLARQGLDWGMCHGDCHMLNDHIENDRRVTFFDFDCCAPGWRAYDLAIMRWCEGFYKMDPGDLLWQAFLKGYTEKRPISEADRASIPTFVALREIWHTALIAWLQPSSGVQGFEHILHRTIRLLREWEAVELS